MKNKRRVLIVEDNPVSLAVMEKILTNDGCEVYAAVDGRSGLATALEARPELILLDILLGDMNGKEVVRRLKTDPATRHIPVVIASNTVHIKDDDGNLFIDIDGIRYPAFAKPVHHQKLLSVIRKTINQRRFNRQPFDFGRAAGYTCAKNNKV
jgi:CheY-like chemotaxis protein